MKRPPVLQWPSLAAAYVDEYGGTHARALLYVGRGHDKPDDATPGTEYRELTKHGSDTWYWNECEVEEEAEETESEYDEWDAGCDRYHAAKDDEWDA